MSDSRPTLSHGSPAVKDFDLRRSDERARLLAQSVFDRPLLVEAGAGTGKTTALVARVLAWGLGLGWERAEQNTPSTDQPGREERIAARVLRRIVAITFTEKAAAEMNNRIGKALRAVECGELPIGFIADSLPPDPDVRRDRARALLGALDHLCVQTIHAYCRRLLVEYALDAGLHPKLEVDADGNAVAEIVRSTIEVALQTAYTDSGQSGFLELAQYGVGPREIETSLLELIGAGLPAHALAKDPAEPSRIAALIDRFATALAALTDSITDELRALPKIAGSTALQLDTTLGKLSEHPPTDPTGLGDWIRSLDARWEAPQRNRLGAWGKGNFNKGEQKALGERADPVSASARKVAQLLDHILSIDLDLLGAAREVLGPLLANVETQLRANGVATFFALLGEALALLRDQPSVCERIRSGMDQLLIDEFQDTDRRQCDIIRRLALQGPEDQRPGLFLVGDPKQSIYGWRSADLAAYDAFVSEILASGGTRERLSVNYRSVPHILEEVERVIEPIMEEEAGLQPAFQPLVASSTNGAANGFEKTGFATLEHWIPVSWNFDAHAPEPTRSATASQLEALALARDLRVLHDRHDVPWESIGVLFRTRSDWEIYLTALREADVPYAVEGDRGYYRRREIIEAASLIRLVLDPNDELAMLTYLRSASVGVPDAALIPLWERQFPKRLRALEEPSPDAFAEFAALIQDAVKAIPADVPGLERVAGWEKNLITAIADIASLRASFAADPVDTFVERLRTRSLFEACEAARFLGASRCANLERFFREVTEALCEGQTAHELLRQLRTAVDEEKQAEESRPVEEMAGAVQLMTIHAAKGLDFEHVYLMQLHKGSGGRGEPDTGVAERAEGFEYRLFGTPSLAWDRVRDERVRVTQAEQVRLLYVAMTRAKHRLVLSGLWRDFQSRSGLGQAIELLHNRIESTDGLRDWIGEAGAADTVAGGAADTVAGGAADTAAEFFDDFGARWRLPALACGPDAQPLPATHRGAELPDESEIAATSERLIELRRQAVERMGRRMGDTASAQAHDELANWGEIDGANRRSDEPKSSSTSLGNAAARAVGTSIHRVLEEFDFAAEPESELNRQRDALSQDLSQNISPGEQTTALAAGRQMLDRMAAGELFALLRSLADRIVARELPVLLPPSGDEGAVGYLVGSIDLVYRDPESDELVVADYKTDSLTDEQSLQNRIASYAKQGAVYQRAIQESLDLPYTPRFELWFLDLDRIVKISDSAARGALPGS